MIRPAYFQAINTFWQKNPALFYGLTLFLGYIFVLKTVWALLPFFTLTHKKRFLSGTLVFLLPCCLIYQTYTFPEKGHSIKGIFTIHSFHKNERYGNGWSYLGCLKTERGKIYCRCFSKKYMPPNFLYEIEGKITDVRNFTYSLKAKPKWEIIKKRQTLSEARFHAQEFVKAYIASHIKQERASHFLTGMITGQMEDRLMRNEFNLLGLSHLLAISGLHFSLITLFFHIILRLVMPTKIEAICLMTLLTLYFLFIGNTPSILRAWSTTMLFLIGQISERRGSALNFLGAALCLSLLINPLSSMQLSLHLSFLATAGILFFYYPFQKILLYWLPKESFKNVVQKKFFWQCGYLITSILRDALALNFSVHLALLPLLFAVFHVFSISSLMYNLFFPFLASLSLLFFLISIPLGNWAHQLNGLYSEWILKITEKPPLLFKSLDMINVSNWLLAATLTLLLVLAIGVKIKERANRFGIANDSLLNHF